MSFALLLLRLAVYLTSRILILSGYVSGVLFVAGVLLWFIGSAMVGYTEQPPKKPQP